MIRLGYGLRRFLLRRLRIRTRGVKVMVFNGAGEILLIRNSYGDRGAFLLPGGGIGFGESPEAAAVREVREEAGVPVHRLAPLARYASAAEGKRDTVFLFRGETDSVPEADGREVVEARFFALDSLPPRVSAATLRRIAELRGERARDGRW
ncbi:MAG: NUDIX domain-containing protein [Alphaproteobacteria bacterium]|nr:NUDIX domain-containing protein [Alphaproteobacteria bacterium]MBV9901686.1 NUDIX domain-containing protein [Alphaproteobacteria bacterium]